MSTSATTSKSSAWMDLGSMVAGVNQDLANNKRKMTKGGLKRPEKKATHWSKANKGVADRASRDIERERELRPTVESARSRLEQKAVLYDQLAKGRDIGLNEKQHGTLLVDFDLKPSGSGSYQPDSDDEDESMTVPNMHEDDDPLTDYEDELGRTRTVRRSQVPAGPPKPMAMEEAPYDPDIIYNPTNHFPVFQQSATHEKAVKDDLEEYLRPPERHYNASRENRARGAGHYSFAQDEETRKREMAELRARHEETLRKREEMGAVNIRPGEVPGMYDEESTSYSSTAMEQRKRKIEAKRVLNEEAKRRRLVARGIEIPEPPKETAPPRLLSPPDETGNFLASLERDMGRAR